MFCCKNKEKKPRISPWLNFKAFSWKALMVVMALTVWTARKVLSLPSLYHHSWHQTLSLTVQTTALQTTFLTQLVSCKPQRNSTHHSTLKRRTPHRRSSYIQDLGQKKSLVSGTSISEVVRHSTHVTSCLRSTFGITLE